MTRDNQFDVIIIGTGAGGGTLAYHLAPSGKRILILERGDYTQAEHLYQVHGQRGEDLTEPRASKAYPWPAVKSRVAYSAPGRGPLCSRTKAFSHSPWSDAR
jgi:choline dehydrogenase-like flavoprotein